MLLFWRDVFCNFIGSISTQKIRTVLPLVFNSVLKMWIKKRLPNWTYQEYKIRYKPGQFQSKVQSSWPSYSFLVGIQKVYESCKWWDRPIGQQQWRQRRQCGRCIQEPYDPCKEMLLEVNFFLILAKFIYRSLNIRSSQKQFWNLWPATNQLLQSNCAANQNKQKRRTGFWQETFLVWIWL